MRLFYCPKCEYEEVKNDYPLRKNITFKNIRDWFGRPITHYKCECGNLLAGSMDVSGWEDKKDLITYAKEIIKGYNKDGCYYTDGFYEFIEKQYEEYLNQEFKR